MSWAEMKKLNMDIEKMLDEKISKKLESKLDGKPTQIETLLTDTYSYEFKDVPWLHGTGNYMDLPTNKHYYNAVYLDGYIYVIYSHSSTSTNICRYSLDGVKTSASTTAVGGSISALFIYNESIYVQIGDVLYKWTGRETMLATFTSVCSGLSKNYMRNVIVAGKYAYLLGMNTSGSSLSSSVDDCYRIDLNTGAKTTITDPCLYVTGALSIDDHVYMVDTVGCLYRANYSDFSNASSITTTRIIDSSSESSTAGTTTSNVMCSTAYSHPIFRIENNIYVTGTQDISTLNCFHVDLEKGQYDFAVKFSDSTTMVAPRYFTGAYIDNCPVFTSPHVNPELGSSSNDTAVVTLGILRLVEDNYKTVEFYAYKPGIPFSDVEYWFTHNNRLYAVRTGGSSSKYISLVEYDESEQLKYRVVKTVMNTDLGESDSYSSNSYIAQHPLFYYYLGKLYFPYYNPTEQKTYLHYIDIDRKTFNTIDLGNCIYSNSHRRYVNMMFEFRGKLFGVYVYGYKGLTVFEILSDDTISDIATVQVRTDHAYMYYDTDWVRYRPIIQHDIVGIPYSNVTSYSNDDKYTYWAIFDGEKLTDMGAAPSVMKFTSNSGGRYKTKMDRSECAQVRFIPIDEIDSYIEIRYDTMYIYKFDEDSGECSDTSLIPYNHEETLPLRGTHIRYNFSSENNINNIFVYNGNIYAGTSRDLVNIPTVWRAGHIHMYLPKNTTILADKSYIRPVNNLKEVEEGYEVETTGLVTLGKAIGTKNRHLYTIR